MKITEDVRKYAAEQGIAEEAALTKGMAEKSKEFVEQGADGLREGVRGSTGLSIAPAACSDETMKMLDANLLQTATQRLVAEFQPEQIWLFGSHAWGTPGEDSDIDLMVIVPQSDERPIRRDQRAQRCLGRLLISADVLVRTRQEVNRVREVLGSLTHEVLQKGRKVYG